MAMGTIEWHGVTYAGRHATVFMRFYDASGTRLAPSLWTSCAVEWYSGTYHFDVNQGAVDLATVATDNGSLTTLTIPAPDAVPAIADGAQTIFILTIDAPDTDESQSGTSAGGSLDAPAPPADPTPGAEVLSAELSERRITVSYTFANGSGDAISPSSYSAPLTVELLGDPNAYYDAPSWTTYDTTLSVAIDQLVYDPSSGATSFELLAPADAPNASRLQVRVTASDGAGPDHTATSEYVYATGALVAPTQDVYRDFAYAKVMSAVDSGQGTIVVDDTTRFPSNAVLAKANFWLAFDAEPSNPAFEIVRLVSKGSNFLVVERSLSSVPHSAGVYIKGVLTAEQMYRARAAFSVHGAIPDPDPDLYLDGDSILVIAPPAQPAFYVMLNGSWLSLSQYVRYVDLGNFDVAGHATVTSLLSLRRQLMASAVAGGATTTSTALVPRGVSSSAAGSATSSGTLDSATPTPEALPFADDFTTETPGTLGGQNGWIGIGGAGAGCQVSSGDAGLNSTTNYGDILHDIGRSLGYEWSVHFAGNDDFKVAYLSATPDESDLVAVVAHATGTYFQALTAGVWGPQIVIGAGVSGTGTGTLRVVVTVDALVVAYWNDVLIGSHQMTSDEMAGLGTYVGVGVYNQIITMVAADAYESHLFFDDFARSDTSSGSGASSLGNGWVPGTGLDHLYISGGKVHQDAGGTDGFSLRDLGSDDDITISLALDASGSPGGGYGMVFRCDDDATNCIMVMCNGIFAKSGSSFATVALTNNGFAYGSAGDIMEATIHADTITVSIGGTRLVDAVPLNGFQAGTTNHGIYMQNGVPSTSAIDDVMIHYGFGGFSAPPADGTNRVTALVPEGTTESTALQEPNVWVDDNSLWHMVYSGGWATQVLCHATAPGPYGPWTKLGTLLGGGVNGVSGSIHCSNAFVEDGVLYLYYADSTAGNLHVATGDATDPSSLILQSDVLTDGGAYVNSTVINDGGTYQMLVEHDPGGSVWEIALASATSPLGPFTVSHTTLPTLSRGGTYSGPWLTKVGSTYVLWYHASTSGSLPSDIYRATSTDLVTWTKETGAYITRTAAYEVDQVADPFVLEHDGHVYVWWDALDNAHEQGRIAQSVGDAFTLAPA